MNIEHCATLQQACSSQTVFCRKRVNLGEAIKKTADDGFDNNFCVNGGGSHAVRVAATVEHEESGRVLEVITDQPGVQFYTDNFLPRDRSFVGKGGAAYQEKAPDSCRSRGARFPGTWLFPILL